MKMMVSIIKVSFHSRTTIKLKKIKTTPELNIAIPILYLEAFYFSK